MEAHLQQQRLANCYCQCVFSKLDSSCFAKSLVGMAEAIGRHNLHEESGIGQKRDARFRKSAVLGSECSKALQSKMA